MVPARHFQALRLFPKLAHPPNTSQCSRWMPCVGGVLARPSNTFKVLHSTPVRELSTDTMTTSLHKAERMLPDNRPVSFTFKPNAKAKPEKLGPALTELLSFPSLWHLDLSGSILHRHVAATESVCEAVRTEINQVADEMNHHPHITLSDLRTDASSSVTELKYKTMTISCTTHNPSGLGMRDVKLARKVEQLLGEHEQVNVDPNSDEAIRESMLKNILANEARVRIEVAKVLEEQKGICFPKESAEAEEEVNGTSGTRGEEVAVSGVEAEDLSKRNQAWLLLPQDEVVKRKVVREQGKNSGQCVFAT